ncbi:hypothetical protein [Paramicrobacterium agarici]|uniref:Uncharacterized protein n=1 Tax=Paramicrobacterium agarici TaxID=630514 RepID=A0A2A9DV77_9MICO|nr:hypothetical protein [Microbacterium agarici]PFG30503.1 hypothetical protein ATJ78_1436 [Microbacterium agarici]TQO23514.1 hypothetical protein FB385_2369 [Microbacterium agarici]
MSSSGGGDRREPRDASGDSILAIRRSSIPFLWVGTIAIIVGGLIAAVTSPLNLEHGSWASAYIVLIVGVALIFFGVTQSLLTERVTGRTAAIEISGWMLGSLAVLGGTLVETPWVVDVGGAILVLTLVVFALAVRTGTRTRATWPLWTFRFVLIVIVVSIPIGLVLSHLRHG